MVADVIKDEAEEKEEGDGVRCLLSIILGVDATKCHVPPNVFLAHSHLPR